ncbi:S-adenosyl-L-methionine-dependent methyltransferase [Cladochytrium replicatum]|nr:S-adenosyl-L-methionine-dependent methyltransferase [Cladochytrium replicatum]
MDTSTQNQQTAGERAVTLLLKKRAAGTWSSSARNVPNPYRNAMDAKDEHWQNYSHHVIKLLHEEELNFSGVSHEELIKGAQVLDVGCGSGIWLAEMHRDYPNGSYFGVDLFIGDFTREFQAVAGNDKLLLLEGDVLKRLPLDDGVFDYVHQQQMVPGIPHGKWPGIIRELGRVVKPGRYIDLLEFDPLPLFNGTPDRLCNEWTEFLLQTAWTTIDLRAAHKISQYVEESGLFEEIRVVHRTVPIGWDGLVGDRWKLNYRWSFEARSEIMQNLLNLSKDEWDEFAEKLLESWTQARAFINMFRITARRRN